VTGVATFATSAFAYNDSNETCATAGYGSGECMNNFSGGGYVEGYPAGNSNEVFIAQGIDRCGGGEVVTSTCPFTNHSMDTALKGDPIFQIQAKNDSGVIQGCTADIYDNALVTLGSCNSLTTGTGGSFATVLVQAPNFSLVDVGWTNDEGSWYQLNSNGFENYMGYFNTGSPSVWTLGIN